MSTWSKQSVNAEEINNGNEYEEKDRLSREAVNAIVNNSLYAKERADEMADRVVSGHGTSIYRKVLSSKDYPKAVTDINQYFFSNSIFFIQEQQEVEGLPSPFKYSFDVYTIYDTPGSGGLLGSRIRMLTEDSVVQFVNVDPEIFAEYGLFIAKADVANQTLTIYTTKVPEAYKTIPFEIMIEG